MIVLVGRSASGKTYLGKCLENRGFHKIVTYTTREKRFGELDKVDYHFISKEDFLKKIKDDFFFEYVCYNGNYYGTSKNSIKDQNSYLIVEPSGLLKYLPIADVISFYIDCPKEILRQRMIARKDRIEDITKRLKNDDVIFADVKEKCHFVLDGTKDVELIIKEVEEKYYGCLKLANGNR